MAFALDAVHWAFVDAVWVEVVVAVAVAVAVVVVVGVGVGVEVVVGVGVEVVVVGVVGVGVGVGMKGPIPKELDKTQDEVFGAIIKINTMNNEYLVKGQMKLVKKVTKEAIAEELGCDTRYIDRALYGLQKGDAWVIKLNGEYKIK